MMRRSIDAIWSRHCSAAGMPSRRISCAAATSATKPAAGSDALSKDHLRLFVTNDNVPTGRPSHEEPTTGGSRASLMEKALVYI